MKKLFIFTITFYFLSGFLFAAPLQEKSLMGEEASLFLNLQHINLGTLSKKEEKRQYLTTIVLEKQRIQNYTLRIIYENAYELFRRGDYERAKELSARILSIDPGFIDAQVLLESSSRVRGGRLLSERDLIREKIEEGERFYEEGLFERAIARWREVLTISPGNIEAQKLIEQTEAELSQKYITDGDSAYKKGKIDKALDNWYKALGLNKNNPEVTARIASAESDLRAKRANEGIQRAVEYYGKGQLLKGYVVLEKVLEVQPGEPKARKLMKEIRGKIALGYVRAGRKSYASRNYIDAVTQWNRALVWGYNKSYVNSLIKSAKSQMKREDDLKLKRAEEARIAAERAAELEKKKKEEELKRKMQEELEASDDVKKRLLDSEGVSEEKKKAAEELYIQGLVHYQKGNYDAAGDAWTRAKKLNPNHTESEAGLKRIDQMYGTLR